MTKIKKSPPRNDLSECIPKSQDSRRTRLLKAAMVAISRTGLKQTTMEMIAREAGVARITVHREFGTRDVLLETLVAFRLCKFHESFFSNVPDSLTLAELIEAYLMASMNLAKENPVTRQLTGGNMSFLRPGTAIRQTSLRAWAPIVEKAEREEGLALNANALVEWLLTLQYLLGRIVRDGGMPDAAIAEMIKTFVLPALRHPAIDINAS